MIHVKLFSLCGGRKCLDGRDEDCSRYHVGADFFALCKHWYLQKKGACIVVIPMSQHMIDARARERGTPCRAPRYKMLEIWGILLVGIDQLSAHIVSGALPCKIVLNSFLIVYFLSNLDCYLVVCTKRVFL